MGDAGSVGPLERAILSDWNSRCLPPHLGMEADIVMFRFQVLEYQWWTKSNNQVREAHSAYLFFFSEHDQLCLVHRGHHVTRKMVAAHPFENRVGDKLREVVLAHQLDKLKMEQLHQLDREPQGERHQDLEMFVTY